MRHSIFIHALYCNIRRFAKSENDLAQIADRAAVSDQVDIPDISGTVRIYAGKVLCSVIVEHTASCFAEIIVTGPCVIAKHMIIILYNIP